MLRPTTDMSSNHEAYVNDLFGFTPSPGSGNRENRPLDGRHNPGDMHFAFGADCKSTLGKSLSVTLDGWAKLRDQAHNLRPMMPLRFYTTGDLTQVRYDLAVVELDDLVELWGDAESFQGLCD